MQAPLADSLDDLELHVLLALSAGTHLVLSLADSGALDGLCSAVRKICTRFTRSVAVLPRSLPQSATDVQDIFARCLQREEHDGAAATAEHTSVCQTLVIPYLEAYDGPVQQQLRTALRDRRLTLNDEVYILPEDFNVIAIVADWAPLPGYLVSN